MGRASSAIAVLSLITTAACMNAPQSTHRSGMEPACAATSGGHACLALVFTTTTDIRHNIAPDLQGTLHWAIYKGGDVSLFGPGDHPEVFGGEIPSTDLIGTDTAPRAIVADVPAVPYQALAFMDHDLNGKSNSGEVVTFPADPFFVHADLETQVEVVLDYVR